MTKEEYITFLEERELTKKEISSVIEIMQKKRIW